MRPTVRKRGAGVDPKHLGHLLAIAEHGSFTGAAVALGISQPALSDSIGLLERRLGVKVLSRSRTGSRLNEFGEILARRARGMRALLDQAMEELHLHARGIDGPLLVGVTPSVLPKWLPDTLRILTEGAGAMDVGLIEGTHDQLQPGLRTGELDVFVGPVFGSTTRVDDIHEEELIKDPYCIALGPRCPFASRKHINLIELRDQPWVLPRAGTPFARQIEASFLNAGMAWPRDCLTSNSLALVREIVCSSNRVSIMSRMQIVGAGDNRLREMPLDGAMERPLGFKVLRGQKLSPLAERFLLALRLAAREC